MTTEVTAAPAAGTENQQPAAPVVDEANAPPLKIEAKPADPPAPTEPKAEEIVVVEYDSTGDAALDVALEFVGRLGIGPEHPAMAAASNGDFSLLEAHLGTLGDKAKGFERMIALGKRAFDDGKAKHEATSKAAAAAEEKTKAAIYAAMGGEENWPAIQAWVATKAEDTEKAEIMKAFKEGGSIAIAMAERLTNLYKKAGGTFKGKAAVKGGAAGSEGAGNVGALSPKDFSAEVAKARNAYRGGSFDQSREYQALIARRNAWKA